MTQRIRWTLVTTGLLVVQAIWPVSQCHGGPFLDWLFGRTPYYAPWGTTAYYPPPSVTPPSSLCAPLCQPTAPPPMVANYTPQVRYRTTWVPIPVTQYRPVMAMDPGTGCPTTGLQPCNSYTWQLRRVPVVSYRPIYSCWSRGLFAPAAPPMVAPAVAPTDPCGVPLTCAPSQPYYPGMPGATLVPGPAMTLPGSPTLAPGPATTVPGTAPGVNVVPSPSPADIPPSLSPSAIQPGGNVPQTRLAPPSGVPNAAADGGARSSTPGRAVHVKPVPDPQSDPSSLPTYEAPQLLNPRDRSAFRAPSWAVVPISWPAPLPKAETRTESRPLPVNREWDDSGWVSARNR